jgi:hypothetical protein
MALAEISKGFWIAIGVIAALAIAGLVMKAVG